MLLEQLSKQRAVKGRVRSDEYLHGQKTYLSCNHTLFLFDSENILVGKTKWATHLREHDSDLKICNQAVFISLSENILAAKVNQVTMDRREHDGDAKIGLIAKTQNMIETCNSL